VKQLLATMSVALLAAPLGCAQQGMGDYLEVFIAKVRPEKRADFDSINRKVAEANRKAKGDYWMGMEVVFGEGNTVQFVSPRQGYAAIDAASNAFMNAIKEAYGPGGMPKMMTDFNSTVVSTRSEIRRRRWDLSVNTPADADAYNKIVGEARWLRTIQIRVREGHEAGFEERVKEAKAALEKGSKWTYFVSNVIAGSPGTTYYVTTLQPSFAAFDSAPKLPELMGQDAFATWQKGVAEDEISSETIIMRMIPELSNAPEEVVKVAPDFWRPKRAATAATKPMPKPTETAKVGQ
jgi:hypothetical protein